MKSIKNELIHHSWTGSQKVAEEGTSLLCKSAPDICASNPQSISYVDKADLSHMLPAYPEGKIPDPRFTFIDKADQSVVDSRLSGFADKEGLMDSRMLSESRQNIIIFSESKEHPSSQEPRYGEFTARVEQCPTDNRVSFADKEDYVGYADNGESLLDTPFGYDTRYIDFYDFYHPFLKGYVILYHKSNLVYTVFFPQFLIFQQNNTAQTSVLIFFMSRHYYFFWKIKNRGKKLYKHYKLNCSYGKVSHALKRDNTLP